MELGPRPGVYFPGSYAGDVMSDGLVALAVAVAVIPIIVVFGLFRLAALKKARDLKASPEVTEWLASGELHTPKEPVVLRGRTKLH